MTIDSSVLEAISPIEEQNRFGVASLLPELPKVAPDTMAPFKDRRQCITHGYDPDTLQELSIHDWHRRLIMLTATQDEWQLYYEKVGQSRGR